MLESTSDRVPDVTLITSMGDIVIELYWNHAPLACRNFTELACRGYYDNTIFHRIVRDFVIQGGDPTGTGRGGDAIYDGGIFQDEIHPGLRHVGARPCCLCAADVHCVQGILSMANSGPHTNRSQFFITLAPTPHLDGKHTIFGRVKSGLEVVKKMSRVQVNATEKPVFDVKILRTTAAISSDINEQLLQ